MKTFMKIISGMVIGVALALAIGWSIMPTMMLHEYQSPYNVQETVDKIKENALSKGWVVAGVKPLHKSIKKNGGGDILPVMLVNLCQANHAYSILQEDENKKVSVFMPCTISVYKKADGKTYVGALNAGLLGKMFGGTVAEVMSVVSLDQQGFIGFTNK